MKVSFPSLMTTQNLVSPRRDWDEKNSSCFDSPAAAAAVAEEDRWR